jgi:hypothetical protein
VLGGEAGGINPWFGADEVLRKPIYICSILRSIWMKLLVQYLCRYFSSCVLIIDFLQEQEQLCVYQIIAFIYEISRFRIYGF